MKAVVISAVAIALAGCGQAPTLAPSAPASAASSVVASLIPLGDPPMSHTLYDLHGQGPPVLLIHGYMGTHKDEADIGAELVAHGYAAYTIDITPWDASVADNAGEIAKAVDEILAQRHVNRLFLGGHSMGGLDARYYVDFLGGTRHVAGMVTVSTPHHGTVMAEFAHGGARADLLLNSDLTQKLNDFPDLVPICSIYSMTDQIVVPFTSAHLDDAVQNIRHFGFTHTSILHDTGVQGEIQAFYDGLRPRLAF